MAGLKYKGVFNLKSRCADRSVFCIKVPLERFESIWSHLLSKRSCGILRLYTVLSVQSRFTLKTIALFAQDEFYLVTSSHV